MSHGWAVARPQTPAICLLLEFYSKRLCSHASQPTKIIEPLCPFSCWRRLVQRDANDLPQAPQVHVLCEQRRSVTHPERARLRELGVQRLILVTRPDPRRIENTARVLNLTVG